jgi:hypothetical protein
MPLWLHETLALGGVLAAALWLVVRLVQVGRPQPGCSRCELAGPTPARPAQGVRSKQLRVIS